MSGLRYSNKMVELIIRKCIAAVELNAKGLQLAKKSKALKDDASTNALLDTFIGLEQTIKHEKDSLIFFEILRFCHTQ
jgi:hypothetical protein